MVTNKNKKTDCVAHSRFQHSTQGKKCSKPYPIRYADAYKITLS